MQTPSIMTLATLSKTGLGTPILIIMILVMMILPLPAFLLDLFFTFNIIFSLTVLLACVYCGRPLDFAVFPTVLLVATLLRLSLNIASTRVVLLDGHTGTDAAGKVIQSFGEVVVGGNYTVGLVVFAILVIINFVVVTKGAGRISEVTARFTLDAMPGKQMAIDADLNAGIIMQDEAKQRRREIAEEADFYGAMDGASKFVRGDAIAGLLILFINIIGGLFIGMSQHGMTLADATHNYALLTIGDGLVAQIPSLLLSTGAAIMVTRVSSHQDIGNQISMQVFANPKTLAITSIVIGGLGIIPGMPHIAFLSFAILAGAGAYYQHYRKQQQAQKVMTPSPTEVEENQQKTKSKELSWDDVARIDAIGLEVGYRLIPLVDRKQDGQLMERIKGVRKKLSQELGFLIPSVHIRDNLDLTPNVYRITLMGVTCGEADIYPDKFLAIDPGQTYGHLEGIATKDPAFGLDAVWIDSKKRDQAQTNGYTVVDASTVVATHLSQLLQTHAAEILGHQETQKLLDRLAETSPKLVEELVPDMLPLSAVVRVLQRLLEEKIPIRDIRTIAETLAEHAHRTKDPDVLTEAVRVALRRTIMQDIIGIQNELPVITLQPELEQILQNTLKVDSKEAAGFEPGLAERLQRSLREIVQRQEVAGQPSVLLVPANLRRMLSRFVRHSIPGLYVLAFPEIPDNKQIRIIGTVG
ncbi:MAG: flagellar biosynthesis protein FlhA [Gammaproteobacteria bacterium]